MKPKYQRGLLILSVLGIAAGAVWMILKAFEDNLVFYKNPSELMNIEHPLPSPIRVGGMVEHLEQEILLNGRVLRFWLRDFEGSKRVPVLFSGWVPDLFKEGAGAVVQGKWTGSLLEGKEILAKHDAEYTVRK